MNKSEKLAVAWSAFKAQINASKKILEERYRKPVLEWVRRFDGRSTEINGALKVYNTPISAVPQSEGLDVNRMAADLEANLEQFTAAELKDLATKGLLRILPSDSKDLADILVERLKTPGYTVVVPATEAGWTDELRDHLMDKGKYDGLTKISGCRSDLLGLMTQTADEILGVPTLTKVPKPTKNKGVALQRTSKK